MTLYDAKALLTPCYRHQFISTESQTALWTEGKTPDSKLVAVGLQDMQGAHVLVGSCLSEHFNGTWAEELWKCYKYSNDTNLNEM